MNSSRKALYQSKTLLYLTALSPLIGCCYYPKTLGNEVFTTAPSSQLSKHITVTLGLVCGAKNAPNWRINHFVNVFGGLWWVHANLQPHTETNFKKRIQRDENDGRQSWTAKSEKIFVILKVLYLFLYCGPHNPCLLPAFWGWVLGRDFIIINSEQSTSLGLQLFEEFSDTTNHQITFRLKAQLSSLKVSLLLQNDR